MRDTILRYLNIVQLQIGAIKSSFMAGMAEYSSNGDYSRRSSCDRNSLDAALIHQVRFQDGYYTGCKSICLPNTSGSRLTYQQTVFALSVAPDASWKHLLHAVCWVWLHLLQADISNQACSPHEDAVNKPYRPLPSGRITLKNALRLRWLLIPVCWVVSAVYGLQVLRVSILFTGLILVYNEGHAAGRWFTRNVMNAGGISCFEAGATLITGACSAFRVCQREMIMSDVS